MGRSDDFPELSDKNWLSDFAFAVDIFSHMNELNVKVQGKDQIVSRNGQTCESFQIQAHFVLQTNCKQIFSSFPHTCHAGRGTAKRPKIQQIT